MSVPLWLALNVLHRAWAWSGKAMENIRNPANKTADKAVIFLITVAPNNIVPLARRIFDA
jgi:hypothetical protein